MAERVLSSREQIDFYEGELLFAANNLEDLCDPLYPHRTGAIYFRDGDEEFSLDFLKVEEGWTLELDAAHHLGRSRIYTDRPNGKLQRVQNLPHVMVPYHPQITVEVATLHKNVLSGFDGHPFGNVDEIADCIRVMNYLRSEISGGEGQEDCEAKRYYPQAVRRLIKRIRQTDRMQYEYHKDDLYDALNSVLEKSDRVDVDQTKYSRSESVLLKKSPEVVMQIDGVRCIVWVEQYDVCRNGDYSFEERIKSRPVTGGSESELFSVFAGNISSYPKRLFETKSYRKVRPYIEILARMDKKLSAKVKGKRGNSLSVPA